MRLEEFINKALVVPFVEKGRDYSGWDCWGSVFCGYKDVYEVILPEYTGYPSVKDYEALRSLVYAAKPQWMPVTRPQPGDVAFFELPGKFCHVAMVVDHKNVLHVENRVGTFIEKINSCVWGRRLEGIYRCLA